MVQTRKAKDKTPPPPTKKAKIDDKKSKVTTKAKAAKEDEEKKKATKAKPVVQSSSSDSDQSPPPKAAPAAKGKKTPPPKPAKKVPAKKSPSPPPAKKDSATTKDLPAKRGRKAAKSPSPSPPPSPKKADKPDPAPAKQDDSTMVKTIRKGRCAVDNICPKAKDCHVFEEPTKIWSATLNQTDIKNNANKYYIIQLLQSDTAQNQYYVWNRWGRVGYPGQNALKGPMGDLERAKNEYLSKLRDKTRGGYIELEIVYDDEEETKEEEKPAKKALKDSQEEVKTESKLDRRVKDLINVIFDLKQINLVLAEIGYDAKKMPLGKLSTNNLKQGLEVLKKIESVLEKKEKGSLEQLSSQFFSLIPHDFGFQHMSNFTINNKEKLQQKIAMIESLTDMKIATNILETKSVGNPVDEHYAKLKCAIQPIERTDPVFQLLSQYVQNTHAQTHNNYGLTVLDIFRLSKDGEDERFNTKIGNDMLLWHGSRLTNWVGILSQGLRIAPPEAPATGYMFGKGVYFADMVSKSANYCFTSRDNNIGCMLLCQVAIGTPSEKFFADYNAANLPAGCHSTKGCGKTAPPETSYVDLEGCKVPAGAGQPTNTQGSLLYNEFIVYDVAQVKMKFLFKMRFDYR
ncbi:unnamed protein product [Blepharisma stoltei]|uniref:Poly [ADP-ribose] polymerase n=1 Tax=Blepharisma stoltei TaxID=1481888 RepID=A0AAU9IHK4_9CILI|nr:unnamed protein product [Blepharisma stoltei]